MFLASENTGCGKLASFFLQTAQFKKGRRDDMDRKLVPRMKVE
jgi:hypothetical protein